MYATISHSVDFYQLNGYKYVQSPWLVDEKYSNITKPDSKENFFVKNKVLVASGEQSFLELICQGQLSSGSYCTTTPCFRDENEDATHKKYFMKTELIYWEKLNVGVTGVSSMCLKDPEQIQRLIDKQTSMIKTCNKFFNLYLETETITNELIPGVINPIDIVSKKGLHELGSYGIREYNDIIWVYGTGVAEPRLTYCVNLCQKPGYHNDLIPKTRELGSSDKITEEYREFIDALKQGNKIMALVELSDLYGAMDFYLKTHFGMTIDHLKTMSDVTCRAFENGRR
jgi:hypothetical protein